MDISQLTRRQSKKLRLTKQIKLLQLMNNLFASGFNLTEVVNFLDKSGVADKVFVSEMRAGLENGESLAVILGRLKFSQQVVTQIKLAESHGNISNTLQLVERNLRQIATVRKKLLSVATYPLMLLGFLVLIMLGLKNYLLPQVDGRNFATTIIENLPTVFLWLLSVLTMLGLLIFWRLKRRSAVKLYELLAKLPLVNRLVKDYLTAYFAREWGVLISQGLDFKNVLQIMTTTPAKIFQEVGAEMLVAMQAGNDFHAEVRQYSFFTPELALMIEYGELKDKLGIELAVYADECWEGFFSRCERAMGLIQPLVFLFVALMIVLIYVAMLLPIYSNMNTF